MYHHLSYFINLPFSLILWFVQNHWIWDETFRFSSLFLFQLIIHAWILVYFCAFVISYFYYYRFFFFKPSVWCCIHSTSKIACKRTMIEIHLYHENGANHPHCNPLFCALDMKYEMKTCVNNIWCYWENVFILQWHSMFFSVFNMKSFQCFFFFFRGSQT